MSGLVRIACAALASLMRLMAWTPLGVANALMWCSEWLEERAVSS